MKTLEDAKKEGVLVNNIYNADCLDLIKIIPDLYKLCLITDPPYGIDYNPKWLSEIHLAKNTQANSTDDKVIGDDIKLDLSWLFLFENRLIFGFPYVPDYTATGWLVWDKQPGVSERGITTPVEVASTTLRTGYDVFRYMWGGFMREAGEIRFPHPTQKPLGLMKRLIEKFTDIDDIIFDPYCGSGSTIVAAKQLGRKFIGIEISEKYCKIAEDRLRQEVLFTNLA